MLVTNDRYRGNRDVLTSELDVDSPLDQAARRAWSTSARDARQQASAYAAETVAVAFDIALDELGGEENICAG